jgi:nitric oxide reductase activation protein
MDDDPGYFGERIQSARHVLILAWQRRAKRLSPDAKHTDVLGALMVAAQVFALSPDRRPLLILFSDMRQDTSDLNLESHLLVSTRKALDQAEMKALVADLRGVAVSALGVDDARRSVKYWDRLKQFWSAYFEKAGASLEDFSILRETRRLAIR